MLLFVLYYQYVIHIGNECFVGQKIPPIIFKNIQFLWGWSAKCMIQILCIGALLTSRTWYSAGLSMPWSTADGIISRTCSYAISIFLGPPQRNVPNSCRTLDVHLHTPAFRGASEHSSAVKVNSIFHGARAPHKYCHRSTMCARLPIYMPTYNSSLRADNVPGNSFQALWKIDEYVCTGTPQFAVHTHSPLPKPPLPPAPIFANHLSTRSHCTECLWMHYTHTQTHTMAIRPARRDQRVRQQDIAHTFARIFTPFDMWILHLHRSGGGGSR